MGHDGRERRCLIKGPIEFKLVWRLTPRTALLVLRGDVGMDVPIVIAAPGALLGPPSISAAVASNRLFLCLRAAS